MHQVERLLAEAQAAASLGNVDQAVQLAAAIAASDGASVPTLIAAGDLLSDLGSSGHAEVAYRSAVQAAPTHAAILRRFALSLFDQAKYPEAEAAFARASSLEPQHARNWNNLGLTRLRQDKHVEAAEAFRRAVALDPNYALAHANLGKTLLLSRDREAARLSLKRAVALGATLGDPYALLAGIAHAERDNEAAIALLQKAAQIEPTNINHLLDLAQLEGETGATDTSRNHFAAAHQQQPNNLKARLGLELGLPQIYASQEQLDRERARFEQGLAGIVADRHAFLANPPADLLDHIQASNFFLAYQGQDDKLLQQGYAEVCATILRHCLPRHYEPIPRRKRTGERLRIGFVSHFLFDHTAGKYFESWITQLDGRFEKFAYATSDVNDTTTRAIAQSSDRFRVLADKSLADIADLIKADQLDVLIYPELGMRSSNYALASLRLAPVQCMAWGHPVTSGHANIDYYLSCDLMEPPDAASHYSETLHLLPGLGTCYARPVTSLTKSRSDYGLPDNAPLLLIPQSLFKIHPANDKLIARTLAAVPGARAVIFSGFNDRLTAQFKARLHHALIEHGLSWDRHVTVLPRTSRADYLRINQLCDVMLDTLYWSGGNTSLDALASGLPVVTLPGVLMRARQTAGMLRLLGCEDMIASSQENYVGLVAKLSEPPERAAASARILAAADRLFDRLEPIRALEEFLDRVAARQANEPSQT
jgi:protein O-GlcNAc transferase